MPTGRISNEEQCCSEPMTNDCRPEEPIPIAENSNKTKRITIEQLDFGYTVTVGCQKFAVENSGKLVDSLREYLRDPNRVEKEWFAGNFLK